MTKRMDARMQGSGTADHGAGRIRLVMACLAGMVAMPVLAQDAGMPDQGPQAPLISAPGDPGRATPGALADLTGEMSSFNSFVPADTPVPMDSFSAPDAPVVIELFTSQGCSSCPPADAMLTRLAQQPGILPLSFHVDYWDYLGWADSFAKPQFGERQSAYARASGERSVYTPQMIVNGEDTAVAPGPAQLMALVDASRIQPAVISLRHERTPAGEAIEVTPLSDLAHPVDVLMVSYAPEREVRVEGGENRGRTVRYTNVVLAIEQVADWEGRLPLRLTVHARNPGDDPDAPAHARDVRHVLLIQTALGKEQLPGAILAAVQLD